MIHLEDVVSFVTLVCSSEGDLVTINHFTPVKLIGLLA